MRVLPRWSVVAALVGSGLLSVCCSSPPSPAEGERDFELPNPDLGQLEPMLRRALEELREEVAKLSREEDVPTKDLAQALGELCQVYHSYELRQAANACYEIAIRLAPDEYRWVYYSALVYRYTGDFDPAVERLRQALRLRPDSVPAWITLGRIELQRGEVDSAREAFQKAMRHDSESAAAILGLGECAVADGEMERAVGFFERTLELQPEATAVHYLASQAYRRLGRSEEAERHLEHLGRSEVVFEDPEAYRLGEIRTLTAFRVVQTMIMDPAGVTPEEILLFALTQLGRAEGTVEALEKILEELARGPDPRARERALLHHVSGGLLVYGGDDLRAIDHFRAALELDGSLVDARIKLANALARNGEFERALAQYSEALQADPENHDTALKRATVLLNLRRHEEARAELKRLQAAGATEVEVHLRVAQVFESSGDPARAEQTLVDALALDFRERDRARIFKEYGDFYQRQGRFEEAVEPYREAVELDATYNDARMVLGRTLGHIGRYAEAADEFARLVADKPRSRAARVGEVSALILAERYVEARERLESAVAVLPGDRGLNHLLARLLAAAPQAELRDGQRALQLVLGLLEGGGDPELLETAAMAYAELGHFDQALSWQARVAERPGGSPSGARARYRLYRTQQAFRAATPEDLLIHDRG